MMFPIGSMYGIYANIGGILMVNVTIYSIHGSCGFYGTINDSIFGFLSRLSPCWDPGSPRNLFYFDSSYRPIPLETSFLGITESLRAVELELDESPKSMTDPWCW